MTQINKLKVTLVRSTAGRMPKHRATAIALGLRKLNQSIEIKDTPTMRGMVNRIGYLLRVEEVK